MSKPRTNTPPCPDCGGYARKNGYRRGTSIGRYECIGEGNDPTCHRRFTDNTKDKPLKSKKKAVPLPPSKELSTDTDVYLFTWAQNASDVHTGFWAALNACREHRKADLNVIRGKYRNPTARNEESDDLWWDPILGELLSDRTEVCPSLIVLADIPVQPTAKRPLTGLDSHTGGASGIIGHPKLEMRVIPTPQNALPKQMITTGACTVQNYSDSKAGKQGEFHHTYGAVIIERRGDDFHMRQLNALHDGSFIDVDTEYLPDGSYRPAERALALSMGDWHSGMTDPDVIEATFGLDGDGADSIVAAIRPRELIWDDVLDQYARNHHHRDNPFIAKAKQQAPNWDRDDLMSEVTAACWELTHYTEKAAELSGGPVKSFVKSSNHDEALTRYIIERNWKNDPVNMEFYLVTAKKMLDGTKMETTGATYPDAFQVWGKELCEGQPIEFLSRRDTYMVGDINCTFHGDIGPNGARGSIMGFAKIGVKTIIAHAHTPGIVDGCYQVGTSTYLNLEYAKGPSSWSHTHCAVYANGKRALLTINNGKWRLK